MRDKMFAYGAGGGISNMMISGLSLNVDEVRLQIIAGLICLRKLCRTSSTSLLCLKLIKKQKKNKHVINCSTSMIL